jgi:uncharacterized protein with NRDE domain
VCLLAVSWRYNHRWPFLFAGNRDEYHSRPAAAADWWQDAPNILGGRDLAAGGSWLGISRNGRFAAVTNRPDLPAPEESRLSRGELVANWLTATDSESVDTLHSTLKVMGPHYGGFSLLTGKLESDNRGELQCFSGGNQSGSLQYAQLQDGITGLSNSPPNKPWPKLTWLNRELARLLETDGANAEQLFELLRREEPVPDTHATGVSARPFIVGQEYGTRCSTIIAIDNNGLCHFLERRFGPNGQTSGESAFEFMLFS